MAKKEEPKKEEEAKDAKKPEGKEGEAPAEGAEGEAPKKSKKKLIIIAVAGVVLLGGGAAGLVLSGVIGGGDKKEEAKNGEHGKEKGEHGEAKEGEEVKCVPAPAGEGGGHGEKKEEPKEGVVYCDKPAYYELPDIVVNLNSTTPRPHFVNLKLTLELKSEAAVAEVETQKPRIIDSFNTYLREVRREDLQGSAGTYRLEKEMMLRLDKILGEGTVKDILFREIIVQ